MLRSRVARVTCAYIAVLVAIFAVWYSTDPAAAAQRSQRASSIDTGGLQVVVSIVQGNPELFGGLWVDENTSQVHVATAAPGAAQLLAGSSLEIIFDSVDRSTQQLESVRSDLTAALGTDQTFRDLYQYDVVDVKTNVVTIGLRQLVPTEIDKLKAQFGESISIVEAADTPKAAGATRLSDTNPFIAGDRVNNRNNGLVCTLGFTARRPDAVVILTAGHCGVRNDVIRTTSETSAMSPSVNSAQTAGMERSWLTNHTPRECGSGQSTPVPSNSSSVQRPYRQDHQFVPTVRSLEHGATGTFPP